MTSLEVTALKGLPLIKAGDDLAGLIVSALKRNDVAPQPQDVLVVAQKIVSKAEGRMVDLATVEPSAKARTLAAETDKDARLVEVILSESDRVVRAARRGVLIVEHRLRLRHGERRGRSIERGADGRRHPRAFVAEGP